jgi:hypothetical protein
MSRPKPLGAVLGAYAKYVWAIKENLTWRRLKRLARAIATTTERLQRSAVCVAAGGSEAAPAHPRPKALDAVRGAGQPHALVVEGGA